MANPEHLQALQRGVLYWNVWRDLNADMQPDLAGADLRRIEVSSGRPEVCTFPFSATINLSRSDLRDADLRGLDLGHCDFGHSDLRGAKFSPGNQFARAWFAGCNLAGTHLAGLNLGKINLSNASLIGADLSGARLHRATIAGADLTNANLRGADLSVASASGARFHGADLTDAQVPTVAESITGGYWNAIDSLFTLAFADGLELIRCGSDFVVEYLSRAFEYAHHPENPDREFSPEYYSMGFNRIRALRTLFYNDDPPGSLVDALKAIDAELIRYLARHPEAMHHLSPRQFEELIAEILASYGWQVTLTPQTRDGGYDIYGIVGSVGGLTTSWVIECKKWSPEHKVDVSVVRALYGLRCEQQHGGALLATTSRFTRDAIQYAASRYNLNLRDYESLIEWINNYRPNPSGRLYIENGKLKP